MNTSLTGRLEITGTGERHWGRRSATASNSVDALGGGVSKAVKDFEGIFV